jgi:hypothetical protein
MLIIGGTFPLTQDCDSQLSWGTHSLDLGKNNDNNAMWAEFNPNLTSYNVPQEVVAAVGGG